MHTPIPHFVRRLLACVVAAALPAFAAGADAAPIDRQTLVRRHNPRVTSVDPWSPLSVGNGGFAFTVDASGLQTFNAHYQAKGIAPETQARWLWHQEANPEGYTLADASRPFTAYGRTLLYPTRQSTPAGEWLRRNPHPLPLPQLALELRRDDGAALRPEEIHDLAQRLDLWTGVVTTEYRVDGHRIKISVAAHPAEDTVAVRIESALVEGGRARIRLAFPRGHDLRIKNNPPLDWSQPETHTTRVLAQDERSLSLARERDESRYGVTLASEAPLVIEEAGPHAFTLAAKSGSRLECSLRFSPELQASPARVATVFAASAHHWPTFWQSGAAIDFSGSTDPRARELERRVVLSQYLMAIQCVGDFPPQETGLTLNSWYGKHHTEMIWWHAAHFALWGRDALLRKNLDWFARSVPIAQALARDRGLRGARWAKMIGPDGRESPGGNPLIVWNQPHPIHLAELLYRNDPTPAMLERYRTLVFESAECLASMLHWDEAKQSYNLGPPLWIAQEIYDQATSMNPTYELSYWSRGLQIAQQWRERLGLPRHEAWDHCIQHLAPLPQKDGKYVAIESTPDTWDNKDSRHDHPSFLMAFGQLPGDGVDPATMHRTLDAVLDHWDWETKIWGWDYPMIAMTAARLGRPEDAVNVLLKSDSPNNGYAPNGHNRQRDDLPVYLPGNGSLLAAVAMMAGGWDGAPSISAPGFPREGWVVRHEGFRRLP